MASIELRAVRKSYAGSEVIHGVDLAIAQGEFMVLVGPSGCGKSTLLRMVAGLEEVSAGEIRFDGRVVNHLNPKHRNVAMVFQNYALYPHMTVRENISLNLRLSKLKRDEINTRVNHAATLLEIEGIMDKRPGQLSGGQRQRVAMGRAIVRDPAVFLFDEPLSNLDAKLRVMMRAEIKALHQQVNTTSLYVTHDQIEAMMLADRIAVLNAGKIEQVGSPLELYHHPANQFVAGFIGSPAMNFLPARIMDGRAVFIGADGPWPNLQVDGLVEEAKLVLGMRPEHVFISSDDHAIPAQVRQVEPTGAQTHVIAAVSGHDVTLVLDGMVCLVPGEQIGLGIKEENLHVFADEDGRSLRHQVRKGEPA